MTRETRSTDHERALSRGPKFSRARHALDITCGVDRKCRTNTIIIGARSLLTSFLDNVRLAEMRHQQHREDPQSLGALHCRNYIHPGDLSAKR